jgi:hypothetical protein
MEHYIKNHVSDITYQSELIPPSCFRKKAGGDQFADGLRPTILDIKCQVSSVH